jgi:hypothetical protein
MTSLFTLVRKQGARRAAAALVLAAMPMMYAVSANAMSYGSAWYGIGGTEHGFATIILNTGFALSCIYIPLAPVACVLLTAA